MEKEALKHFGVPIHLKAYGYLKWLLENKNNIDIPDTAEGIYTVIAKQFNCGSFNIENNIRSCCKYIVDNMPPEKLYALFGDTLKCSGNCYKLQNKVLMLSIIDYLTQLETNNK